MSGIEVRTKECYNIELAKQHVHELMRITSGLNHQSYVKGLLDSLYQELEYQHDVLRSPALSRLAAEQPGHSKQG